MKSPLLFVLTLPVLASDLPKGANRVDSCPKPYDKEAWKNASIELGCSEHISSSNDIRTKTYYHCLASAYINETIEFCAKVAAIERGKCPIYNYAKGATVATSRSCANYTKGCPNPRESPYYSWSFFKYPECWSINKVSRCFHEEPNCPPDEKGNDTLPTDETTTTSTTSTDQRWIFIVTGLTSLVILTCLVYFFFKMNRRRRQRKTKEKPEEETNMKLLDHKDDKIEEKNVGEVYFASPPKTAQPHQEMPVISSPLETSLESQSRTKGQDVGPNSSIDRLCDDLPSVLYSDLLYTLTEAMTKDLCHRIIHVLKDQKKDLNILNRIHEAKELIDYMDGNYLKRNDVIYVQIISWKFKALPLYELCLDYAKRIPKDVSFVEIKTEKDKTKCIIYCPQQSVDKKQKTKLKEMLACYLRFDDCVFKDSHDDNSEVQPFVNKAVDFPKESDRNKEKTSLEFHMENQSESAKEALQKWIEELNEPHPEKINYEVLPESPNVVTTRSSCEHAEAFLKYVKTDEGQTAAFTKKVKRIIHINEVITIEDALNGSNFVHVSLRRNKNQTRASKEDLKEAASMVVKESGVKMVGNTVYVRESTGNTCESGGIIFIEKNWNSLLNNLELSTLLSVEEVVSCFDEDDIARIKSFENRRSKVDHLLKMCIKLPTEKLEKVLPHLEKCVPSCTASPSSSELDSARNWIHQKRDILLEELELDFIEKSLSRMHDVPSDVTNGDLRRKEKIQNFIEFVLQNDDAVMLIQKEMAEFVQDM